MTTTAALASAKSGWNLGGLSENGQIPDMPESKSGTILSLLQVWQCILVWLQTAAGDDGLLCCEMTSCCSSLADRTVHHIHVCCMPHTDLTVHTMQCMLVIRNSQHATDIRTPRSVFNLLALRSGVHQIHKTVNEPLL